MIIYLLLFTPTKRNLLNNFEVNGVTPLLPLPPPRAKLGLKVKLNNISNISFETHISSHKSFYSFEI